MAVCTAANQDSQEAATNGTSFPRPFFCPSSSFSDKKSEEMKQATFSRGYAKSICFSTRIGDESSNLCELPPCFALLRQRNRASFRISKNRRRQEGEKPEGNEEKKSTSSSREFRLLLLDLPTYLHTHCQPIQLSKSFLPPSGRTDRRRRGSTPFYQFRREKGRKRNRQEG